MSHDNAALELLNSLQVDTPGQVVDQLDDDAWVLAYLARWSLPRSGLGAKHARLRELRDALRSITQAVAASGQVSDDSIRQLQRWLPVESMRWTLQRDDQAGVVAVQAPRGRRAGTTDIALAFSRLLAGDGPRRLKLCQNPDCVIAFFDVSRNRSRRWCDATDCGNVAKVRAFRRRQSDTRA